MKFMLVGTASTPTGLGVMQKDDLLYPVCGACYLENPFKELNVDDVFECRGCGKFYEKLEACDTEISTAANPRWVRYTISKWIGVPETNLDVRVDYTHLRR